MKFFRFIIIGFLIVYTLLFGLSFTCFTKSVVDDSFSKTSNISIEPINFDTEVVYNYDILYGKESIKSDGKVGYMLVDSKTVLVNPINRVVEIGRGFLSINYGSTTGYGADCVGCSGNVSCGGYSLKNGVFYNDSVYGKVRILAADNRLFSCGTIIEVDNGIMEPFMGIVMDTGGAMRSAYNNGNILIDIAFPYENSSGINSATNRSGNVSFKVYRYGW